MRSLIQPFLSVQNLAKFGENFNNFFKFPKFEKKNQLKKKHLPNFYTFSNK
jgi:hypothetical protein